MPTCNNIDHYQPIFLPSLTSRAPISIGTCRGQTSCQHVILLLTYNKGSSFLSSEERNKEASLRENYFIILCEADLP